MRVVPSTWSPCKMSWLFRADKVGSQLSSLTSLQQQRQRQIDSLRASHNTLAEIQKDVDYRLPFTVNNLTVNINIFLPPQFPQEKPVISVYPPVRHHLMDKQGMYVTCPLISNFTMHSDLGKIIQSLLDEFWKSPPVLAPSNSSYPYLYHNPSSMPPYASHGFVLIPPYSSQEVNLSVPASETVVSPSSNYTATKSAAPAYGIITDLPVPVPTTEAVSEVGINGFSYKMPDVPDVFPELSELSVSQLKDMNDQEDILLEQFVNLPLLKQIITDKDDLVKNIEDLAKKNLQMEPVLEAKRHAVLDKHELITQMRVCFEKKMQRQHELSESCSLSALQARLKVAAHEAEEESDTIAEDFLEGKSEIDDFLSNFMDHRTSFHSRRAKEEKLQQAILLHS